MLLTPAQIERFHRDGFLVLPNLFSPTEIAILKKALPSLYAEENPANIREKKSGEVRTSMGLHLRHDSFAKLVRHPRLIEPAFQLLGERLYVQLVKVNTKVAFEGEIWQWHYDFATHHAEDGVPEPLALNLHVFLDDVVEFNGPLYFIPGSHKRGPVPAQLDVETTSYPLWVVARETVTALVAESGGLFSATGAAGTALIFGDCLVHASPPNLSPWDRGIFSVIVNPISNAYTKTHRPEYKHHRDLTPVVPLDDDCLVTTPAVAAQ